MLKELVALDDGYECRPSHGRSCFALFADRSLSAPALAIPGEAPGFWGASKRSRPSPPAFRRSTRR